MSFKHVYVWLPLSSIDTFGTKIIGEVSLFQGDNNIMLGLSQVSWLTKVSLFQRCPLSEVPLY